MSSKVKTIARRLLRQNRGTRLIDARSWRVIAREDYENKIPAGTLCRFAVSEGEWIPKDEGLQIVLGLRRPRKVKTQQACDLFDMPMPALLKAIQNREPMPEDPRMFNAFKKAGFFKRVRSTT